MAPIKNTHLSPAMEFTATQMTRGTGILDAAGEGKVVRITRRRTSYLVILESHALTFATGLLAHSTNE